MREEMLMRVAAGLRSGNTPAAIEALRDLLTEIPDESLPHALLATALLRQRRLHAARHEADLAIALDPRSDIAHRTRGYVAMAGADLRKARLCMERAIEIDPQSAETRIAEARVALAARDLDGAGKAIEAALALEPGSADARILEAELLQQQGRLAEAEAAAREALTASPHDTEAMCRLGEILLARGDTGGAKELALWALQQDATDATAIALLSDVKMKESLLLGLWWRYNSWLSGLGSQNAMAVLTGMYVLYFLAIQALDDFGRGTYVTLLTIAWLVFCVYTWSGAAIRDRMVAKELEQVRLRPDF